MSEERESISDKNKLLATHHHSIDEVAFSFTACAAQFPVIFKLSESLSLKRRTVCVVNSRAQYTCTLPATFPTQPGVTVSEKDASDRELEWRQCISPVSRSLRRHQVPATR